MERQDTPAPVAPMVSPPDIAVELSTLDIFPHSSTTQHFYPRPFSITGQHSTPPPADFQHSTYCPPPHLPEMTQSFSASPGHFTSSNPLDMPPLLNLPLTTDTPHPPPPETPPHPSLEIPSKPPSSPSNTSTASSSSSSSSSSRTAPYSSRTTSSPRPTSDLEEAPNASPPNAPVAQMRPPTPVTYHPTGIIRRSHVFRPENGREVVVRGKPRWRCVRCPQDNYPTEYCLGSTKNAIMHLMKEHGVGPRGVVSHEELKAKLRRSAVEDVAETPAKRRRASGIGAPEGRVTENLPFIAPYIAPRGENGIPAQPHGAQQVLALAPQIAQSGEPSIASHISQRGEICISGPSSHSSITGVNGVRSVTHHTPQCEGSGTVPFEVYHQHPPHMGYVDLLVNALQQNPWSTPWPRPNVYAALCQENDLLRADNLRLKAENARLNSLAATIQGGYKDPVSGSR